MCLNVIVLFILLVYRYVFECFKQIYILHNDIKDAMPVSFRSELFTSYI